MAEDKKPKKRVSIAGVLLRLAFAGILWWVVLIGVDADRAIPAGWNPLAPLKVSEPVTLLTQWRLQRTLADPESCLVALESAAQFVDLPDFEVSEQCYIKGRVDLTGVGKARISPIETRCAIALRMAMWERHSLQPAAQAMDTSVTGIDHIGSYNCRQMRTSAGAVGRMSTHATADAIDISGFRFADGRYVRLIRDWSADDDRGAFLRKAKQGACKWFQLTLSPDYNALHADHFHLQSKGWGGCR